MRAIASLLAEGIMDAKGVAENCGNLKFIPAANLNPKKIGLPNAHMCELNKNLKLLLCKLKELLPFFL